MSGDFFQSHLVGGSSGCLSIKAGVMYIKHDWLVVLTILKKYEFVNGVGIIPHITENKIHV